MEDFSQIRVLVDVGGGHGELIAAILERHPHMRGIVFDLPETEGEATARLARAGMSDRASFVGGDFFGKIPRGADGYLLAGVLRDWSDGDALRILASCPRAAAGSGCLIIVEPAPTARAVADLHRMVLFGSARDRSIADLRALVAAVGGVPRSIRTLTTGVRLIDATWALTKPPRPPPPPSA